MRNKMKNGLGMKRRIMKASVGVQMKVLNMACMLKEDESGMGMVEIAIIIMVIIALGVVFKEKIMGELEEIFESFNYSKLQ